MNKKLIVQGLQEFYIYEVDTYRTEYVSRSIEKINSNINMFFVSSEENTIKKKKKNEETENYYIIEVERTNEIETFIKNKTAFGVFFKNALNKNKIELFQVFYMELTESDNPNKVAFKLSKYRNKFAMGFPINNYENTINELKRNILYLIER